MSYLNKIKFGCEQNHVQCNSEFGSVPRDHERARSVL